MTTNTSRNLSSGLDIIKKFEGLELDAYRCPAGYWTIGYGHRLHADESKNSITIERAEELLVEDVQETIQYIDSLVPVPLSDSQFSALLSLVYNIGVGNFKSSTLLKKLLTENYSSAGEEFKRWVYSTNPATGKPEVLQGLVNRRNAEYELWNSEVSLDSISTEEFIENYRAEIIGKLNNFCDALKAKIVNS